MSGDLASKWQVVFSQMLMAMVCYMAMATTGPTWIRDAGNCVWGTEKGLRVAIEPGFFKRCPRGLIHVMYPTLDGGLYDLVNFFAIEPIVKGQRGFSELEHSRLDDRNGLRLWTDLPQGKIKTVGKGVSALVIPVKVEKFLNGAHVRLELSIRSDNPDEVRIQVFAEPDSAQMDECIITATMGNKARTRVLYLKDKPVISTEVWPNYKETFFTEHTVHPASQFLKLKDGSLLAAYGNDEKNPRNGKPVRGSEGWAYHGFPVTQYWRVLPGTDTKGMNVWLNGRYTYWGNLTPIPGGIAYENCELRAPWKDGQIWVFGMTKKTPKELGFKYEVKLKEH